MADELRKALELGYRVLNVLEGWEYNVAMYDNQTNSPGLFTAYVNSFLKLKQECSGWPEWCTTDEQKREYVRQYKENENIDLDAENISQNSGLRLLAKCMLNSFWGKFGQKENSQKTDIVDEPLDLFKLITNHSVNVNRLMVINSDVLLATSERVEDDVNPLKTVNVAIAAYTTAGARLELYNYLEKLGRRVLYYDTDSVIFTHKEGEWLPQVGDFLGNMTDEMTEHGQGSHIVEFVSGGPKNYGLKYIRTNKNT